MRRSLCRRSVWVGILVLGGGSLGAAEPAVAEQPEPQSQNSLFEVEAPELRLSALAAEAPVGSLLGALDPTLALGQADDTAGTADRSIGFKAGLGFSSFPTTFLMGYQADFFLNRFIAIGPLLQFGIADNDFFFAPTVNLQTLFDLPVEGLEALKPCFQFGLGLMYRDKERHGRDEDEVGFLLNFGVGLEYFVTDYFAIGTNFLFDVMPDEVVDENFTFGWQVITLRFQF